jgi:CheY-like chemotaxis protein
VKGRVLIVDDEPDVGIYLATALRANGFTASVATSAEAAMGEVAQSRPDLICLDVMMPRESGLSMFSELRTDPATADIPVIVISGAISEGQFDISEYVEDEAVRPPERFLEKPVAVDAFIDTVGELLAAGARRNEEG